METTLQTILQCLPLAGAIVGAVVAIVKGFSKNKASAKLTENEQRSDMDNYMRSECSNVEQFSSFLKTSMSKEQLSAYKKNTVLRNCKMYAMAQNYTWYNEGVMEENLKNYIAQANEVSGKKVVSPQSIVSTNEVNNKGLI